VVSNKKILLVTEVGRKWSTNYGGVLQALALKEYLEKHGYSVTVLDYNPESVNPKLPHLRARILWSKVKKILRGEMIWHYGLL